MRRSDINFDLELSRGLAAYNDRLGEWWNSKANDAVHARAYRNIAAYIRASVVRQPRVILDYGCGAGHLLARLLPLFPDSLLIGLDGSSILLNLARRRLGRLRPECRERVRLIETTLPARDFSCTKADLVVYVFPNMVGPGSRLGCGSIGRAEKAMAQYLAREGDCEDKPESIRAFLLMGRSISRDLRRLVRRGGLCVRAEYAGARREELSKLEFTRISFEEGSLDVPVDGRCPRQWFRVLASAFCRSSVIGDVHQQEGKRRGGHGGYLITVMRAL